LTAILGGRTGVVFIQYVLNSGEVKRYDVESAALWFVLFAATSLFLNVARPDAHRVDTPRVPIWSWLLWCAATFALFSPALTIGFLSDDFVLADRAGHFDFGFVNPDFFRPVPLACGRWPCRQAFRRWCCMPRTCSSTRRTRSSQCGGRRRSFATELLGCSSARPY